jgi:predicted phage tail protein
MTASVSGARVTLGWQTPASGSAPTHYLLYVGTASGYSNVLNAYNVGNTLQVSGDLPRGHYYARVRAANAVGMSLSSNEATFRVGRRLSSPTGFRVTWSGTTATLAWTAPSADVAEDVPTNYVLEAGTAPGLSNAAVLNVGNVTSFRTEVPAGIYYVRVRAENQHGGSDPSEEIEVRAEGGPQAPTGLVAYGSGATVDLRWTASAGGYAATGYVIEAGSAPGLSDLATLHVGNVTRFVTEAPPGTYYVRVRALNARGPSAPSNEIVVRR